MSSKRYEWALDHRMKDVDLDAYLLERGYKQKLDDHGQPTYEKFVTADREIGVRLLSGRMLFYFYWLTGGASEPYFEYLVLAGYEVGQIANHLGCLEYDGTMLTNLPSIKRVPSLQKTDKPK